MRIKNRRKKMKDSSSSRLGKGLSALFGEETQNILAEIESGTNQDFQSEHRLIDIDKIIPNPYQPRKEFDQEALEELKESILQHGLISPILVRKGVVGYELIAGERRLRASKLAGLKEIPSIIVDFNDQEMMEISIIENIQRKDLNVIEEANAYQTLIDKLGITQEEMATKMNKSRSYVTNTLRLLKLPVEVQQMVVNNLLSMGHVRALLSLDSKEKMLKLAQEAVAKNYTVRQVEQLVKEKPIIPIKVSKQPKQIYRYPIELIENTYQTKATIIDHEIRIRFTDTEDLNRILELMGVIEKGLE